MSKNELPEWVTKKHVVSDTKDFTTATMTQKNKKYKWCTSCNNGQGAWGFHWKDGHEEWKNNQGKKPSARFSNPTNNALIFWPYLITTNEESMEEEAKGGDDSQNNDFISLSCFWATLMTPKESFLSPNAIFLLFYDVDVALDLAWEGELLEMESEDKLEPVSQ